METDKIIELIRECNEGRCDYWRVSMHRGWGAYHGGRPGCYLLGPYSKADADYQRRTVRRPAPLTPEGHWAIVGDLALKLAVDESDLRKKLAELVEAGLANGCACGCRGDFTVPGNEIGDRMAEIKRWVKFRERQAMARFN